MIPNGEHGTADCEAVSEILARVGDKWTVVVMELLIRGPMRFSETRRAIEGISQRSLTLTLRGLERNGLVKRTVDPAIPPRVSYELTPLGHSLRAPIASLAAWARANRPAMDRARRMFETGGTEKPSHRRTRRAARSLVRPPHCQDG